MYTKHFGLRREPFSIAPDPRFLFMSERHREALAHLLYGLKGSGGVVLLTGEIGAGKTTVCRCFLEQIPAKCNVAYIFNPKLTVIELLQTICEEFHITLPTATIDFTPSGALDIELPATSMPRTVKEHVDALNAFLLAAHARGENNVLIIDEAQNLSADVLEQLRLLTNLETAERKLLQIVLIGQPELRALLARPEMEQLAQRITARYHLEALNEDETVAYIRHRLVISGRTGGNPFDSSARPRIHRLARGVPRRINLLCDRAMLGAYARGSQRINATMIDEAAKEVFGPEAAANLSAVARRVMTRRGSWAVMGAAGGALAVGLLMWAWPSARQGAPEAVSGSVTAPAASARVGASAAGKVTSAAAPLPAPSAAPNGGSASTASGAITAGSIPPGANNKGANTAGANAAGAAGANPSESSPTATSVAPDTAAATPSPAPGTFVAGGAPSATKPSPAPMASSTTPTSASTTAPAVASADTASTAAPIKPIRDEFQAWRLLALSSQVSLGDGSNPCQAADRLKLSCTRRGDVTMDQLRRSNEPTLLILRESPSAPMTYLIHTGASDERTITVRGDGGERVKLDQAWLAARWRGEVGNFRSPPNLVTRSTP